MKYTFIGDIHGKVEQVERALAMEGKKIFVGDFQDSFTRSPEDHAKCLDLVLAAVDTGEVEAIYGNHELSYIMEHHKCSGWDTKRWHVMVDRAEQIKAKFKTHILISPDILVTHAGLTNQLWEKHNLSRDTMTHTLDAWWPNPKSPMHQIGRYRGGWDEYGGLFWCDWNAEFEPVPGLTQIFGHTAGKGIRQVEQNFCIDCLDHENSFLHMEI